MTVTVIEALQASARRLREAGIEEYKLESEYLVAAAMRIPRTHLPLKSAQPILEEAQSILEQWMGQRASRKPLAYVLGEQPFMDLELTVNPSVLVPRPETELLVERALSSLESQKEGSVFIDVGTGSGNIAISIARQARKWRIIGTDISSAALEVASANAAKYKVGKHCEWVQGNLLQPIQGIENVQMIVANLPYVKTGEVDALEPELHWEPRMALDGGPEGLDLIFRLISEAADILQDHGILLLEIGADQAKAVSDCLENSGQWVDIHVFDDLAKLPRIVQAQRRDS